MSICPKSVQKNEIDSEKGEIDSAKGGISSAISEIGND